MNRPDYYDEVARRLIEAAGHTTQSLGAGRVLGQLFAYLYLSRAPRTLNDMTTALGISKGSASTGVRQLEQWGALEKIWVKGDRKDYYRARDQLGAIVKNAVRDLAGKRLESAAALLAALDAGLRRPAPGDPAAEDAAFLCGRIAKMQAFVKKAQGLWNGAILRLLLRQG